MKKVITLFCRNYDSNRLVRNEVVPGSEWVLAGEGVATEKLDGTACMVKEGRLFKRYQFREGKHPPEGFILEERFEQKDRRGRDVVELYGWVPVGTGPEDKYHREAFGAGGFEDGTYELLGPKVQGNPYNLNQHELRPHGKEVLADDPPRDFEGLRRWFEDHKIEGIVWHRGNGDMVKIKRRDFGLEWPVKPDRRRASRGRIP